MPFRPDKRQIRRRMDIIQQTAPRKAREYCTLRAWTPSAPMVGEDDDIFSPAAAVVLPVTLGYLSQRIPGPHDRRQFLLWLSEAYHFAARHSASEILPRKEMIRTLRITESSAPEAQWFGCVYLGRMFTAYAVAPNKRHDLTTAGVSYACALLDHKKNEKASWKIQLGIPMYATLLDETFFNVYLGLTREAYADTSFVADGESDREVRLGLFREMSVFVRILFDDYERRTNANRK